MRVGFMLMILFVALPVSADRLVRIHDAAPGTCQELVSDGIDVAASNAREGWVDIYLPDREVDRAALYSSSYELLPVEWGMLLEESRGNAGFYYSWEENNAFWATLAATHSDLVDTPVSIGTSVQGRAITMIRITSDTGAPYKPAILFTALTHAREPGGNSVVIDWANWLTTNYNTDTMATWILDNTTIYIVPIVNPDGYIYNCNPVGGGNWRKNMSAPNGVDLNRNFSYQWGYDDYGSSPDQYDETYRGPSAGSEPETQAVMNFINSIDPIAGFHYHAYGGYLIHPWNYNNSATPDEATFDTWGAAMTQYNGYDTGRCGEVLGYNSNGDSDDWGYWSSGGHPKMMVFTPEVNDNGFWGGQSDTSRIVTICAECRYMNKWLCMTAPGSVGIEEQEGTTLPGVIDLGSVWPNPASTQASAFLTIPVSGETEIKVLDLSGRVVVDLPATSMREGRNLVTVPLDGLPSGIYMIRVSCSGQMAGSMFTVLR